MFSWYVINTYSGHENKVKQNLEHRIMSMGQQTRFRRVVVPTEQVIETKDGQKVQIEKRVLPGYVLVNMDLNDEAWTVVKGTPGVTAFVGAGAKPVPLSQAEVDRILHQGAAGRRCSSSAWSRPRRWWRCAKRRRGRSPPCRRCRPRSRSRRRSCGCSRARTPRFRCWARRDRQGGLRERGARREWTRGQDGRHQLRRHPEGARRERAVRLREGRALDGAGPQDGPRRSRRRWHAVPRRDRRHAARAAVEAPALPAGSALHSARRDPRHRGRRAHHRRDEPHAPEKGGGHVQEALLGRLGAQPFVLPPLRDRIEDIGRLAPISSARGRRREASSPRPSTPSSCTAGRSTCASC